MIAVICLKCAQSKWLNKLFAAYSEKPLIIWAGHCHVYIIVPRNKTPVTNRPEKSAAYDVVPQPVSHANLNKFPQDGQLLELHPAKCTIFDAVCHLCIGR